MHNLDSMAFGACSNLNPAGEIDHGDCIVCSDAAVPVRVVALVGDDAVCEDTAGSRVTIAIELVTPVAMGDVLLAHGGVAIGKVIEEERNEVRQ